MMKKKDKRLIYNSREWHIVREAKIQHDPLCELCKSRGIVTSAQAVHHIIPIETASSFEDMRELAFRFTNLMSVCFACHGEIHRALRSATRESHRQATANAIERWAKARQGEGDDAQEADS